MINKALINFKVYSIKSILFLSLLTCIISCSEVSIPIEEPFYFYDFESDYTNIEGVYVSEFDGDKVMGPYNNSGFQVKLENLGEHEYLKLTFDLYIHDTWEGNSNDSGTGLPDHDAWFIEFDRGKKVKSHEKILFETTFSNGPCEPGYCFAQSYPNDFPFYNEARKGAYVKYLKGRCLYSDSPYGSSLYKLEKIFPHKNSDVVISFYDRLKQNAPFDQLCEESWSIDNLNISIFRY